MVSYSAIITSAEVIKAGGQVFKIATSRFVNIPEEEINLMKENAMSEEYQTCRKVRNDTLQKTSKVRCENCAKRNEETI